MTETGWATMTGNAWPGKSALVASRNDDVRAMNELAREAVCERIGEERVYATGFGERTFGIGDVLVGRERAHGGVNGDLYTLAVHRDDGRLELVASARREARGMGFARASRDRPRLCDDLVSVAGANRR